MTEQDREEVKSIIEAWMDSNGAAVESDIPIIGSDEIDDTISLPGVRYSNGQIVGYVRCTMGSFKGAKGDPGEPGAKGDAGTTDYNDLENKPDLSIYMQEVSQEQFNEIFNN